MKEQTSPEEGVQKDESVEKDTEETGSRVAQSITRDSR